MQMPYSKVSKYRCYQNIQVWHKACNGVVAEEKMKKQDGFTIYEVLTVIAILAVLASLAIPNMISWRTEAKLRGATNNLRADMQMAKLRALRENAIVAVVFTADGYSIFLDNGVNAGDWNLDADESLLKTKQLPPGVTIILPTTFSSSNNRTRFNGRGFPDQATLTGGGITGTVMLQNTIGSQMQLTMNRLGRISDS
jgi:type IV fimbrial biogenesis protein FimT